MTERALPVTILEPAGIDPELLDHTLSLRFDLGQFDPRITFTRNSSATYFGSDGLLKLAAANEPRIDHNPITGECLGLLIEEQRTNLLTYSEQFDNAAWIKVNASITPNAAIAPDGTLTADKLVENTAAAQHTNRQPVTAVPGITYTFSCYLKAGERTQGSLEIYTGAIVYKAVFNLVTGVFISSTGAGSYVVTPAGNGWFRFAITAVASTATLNGFVYTASGGATNYTGDGTSGMYIWGAQLEVGAFPTSYIKTEAASVTRAADSAAMTGSNFSSWYRQGEGTMVAELIWPTTAFVDEGAGLSFSDGTGGNRIAISRSGSGAVPQVVVSVGSIIQAAPFSGVVTANEPFRFAFGYKQDNFGVALNGTQTENSTDNSGTIPVVSILRFGSANGDIRTKGVKRLTYYPRRLSNAKLQALTQ